MHSAISCLSDCLASWHCHVILWVCAGKVLNYAGVSVLTPAEMSTSARRVLRFIDLGGHEKYLKTALYGMTCMVSVTAMHLHPRHSGASRTVILSSVIDSNL